MTRKYKFTIATQYVRSGYTEEKEIEFDDDCTEDEIEEQVCEVYNQWLNENNYGGFEAVS